MVRQIADLAILEKIQSEARNHEKTNIYSERSLADVGTRKMALERALSWIARALIGEETGSVVSVCLEVVEIPLVGLRLVFSTNRSAQTDNHIDRQNFGVDKKASEELAKLLSNLIARYTMSRTQQPQPNLPQIGEHEDLLLQFLIKRSKARVIKKATNLYKQVTEGLDTTLEKLVLPPNPNYPTAVTNWADSLAKLRRLAKPLTNKNNALIPKQIRVLSDYCTTPTKCSAHVTRDVFEQLKQLFKVPMEV